MRLTDLVVFPVAALWQQKSRTALTTLGVVFGAFVLAASLSINHGVQETIFRESHRTDALRRIHVHPQWGGRPTAPADDSIAVEGAMSEEKRRRIRAALAQHQNLTGSAPAPTVLSDETLHKLAALEHVQTVEPGVSFREFVTWNGQSREVQVESARPRDPPYERRIVAGRFFETDDEPSAVISEFLLYRWGIADDDAVADTLGKKLRIEIHVARDSGRPSLRLYLYRPNRDQATLEEVALIERLSRQLPQALDKFDLAPEELQLLKQALAGAPESIDPDQTYSEDFTIVGVIRQVTDEEWKERRWWDDLGGGSDLFLPCRTAARFYFRSPTNRAAGVHQALLVADDEEHVKPVLERVKALGLGANAPVEFIERERLTWRLVFGGMTCIAAVALIVSAVGIANTMLMNVLERTREIGVMKAVGAAAPHVQTLFLIEGGLIGAAGSGLGLLLAWGASFPGDAWVRSMVERDMNVRLIDALFVFPPWLILTVIVFTVVVTTGAAVYPARRAARIDPVAALRHE